jgi:hypothetical protein
MPVGKGGKVIVRQWIQIRFFDPESIHSSNNRSYANGSVFKNWFLKFLNKLYEKIFMFRELFTMDNTTYYSIIITLVFLLL